MRLTPAPTEQRVTFGYCNWRGNDAVRQVVPLAIWFGSNEWHPEPQWLLRAFDRTKAT